MSRLISIFSRIRPYAQHFSFSAPTWTARRNGTCAAQQSRLFATSVPCSKRFIHPEGAALLSTKQNAPYVELTPEGRVLQRELAKEGSDPVATLNGRLQAGALDLETARVCMEVLFTKLKRLRRSERPRRMRDAQIGGMVLQWLWSDNYRWATAVTTDSHFQKLTWMADILRLGWLAYFAVAEGQEDLLVQWLAEPFPREIARAIDYHHQWRGSLLRNLVAAHLMLDCHEKADDAINLFSRVGVLVKVARQQNPTSELASCNLWPAEVELGKGLGTGSYSKTSTNLYERFVEAAKIDSDEFTPAKLGLCHPTRPDPQPALLFIQQSLVNLSRTEFQSHFPSASKQREAVYFLMRRAETVLRARGREEDANSIKELLPVLLSQQDIDWLEEKFRMRWRIMDKVSRKSHAPIRKIQMPTEEENGPSRLWRWT
ncbi:hypothetical protein LTS10_001339 [Elasticomyces elasticus]|nr:hypothetical protein LTS10_001339 [Elasticomyces elasticus]